MIEPLRLCPDFRGWQRDSPSVDRITLPGVPTLSNMMGDVNHDNASEAADGLKLSERIEFTAEAARNFYWKTIVFPHREKKWCHSRLSPHSPAFRISTREAPHWGSFTGTPDRPECARQNTRTITPQ